MTAPAPEAPVCSRPLASYARLIPVSASLDREIHYTCTSIVLAYECQLV